MKRGFLKIFQRDDSRHSYDVRFKLISDIKNRICEEEVSNNQ